MSDHDLVPINGAFADKLAAYARNAEGALSDNIS